MGNRWHYDPDNDPGMSFLDAYKMSNSPGFQSTATDYSSAGESDGDKNAFSGAFSKDFGDSFLNFYKAGKLGQGGGSGDKDQQVFSPGSMGGGSIAPIGSSSKHSLYTFNPAQAQVIQNAPGAPGLGEQLGSAAIGAGVSAGVKWAAPKLLAAMACDERVKVDIAPLESTEVNDSLAEIAFFVKGLRECA